MTIGNILNFAAVMVNNLLILLSLLQKNKKLEG